MSHKDTLWLENVVKRALPDSHPAHSAPHGQVELSDSDFRIVAQMFGASQAVPVRDRGFGGSVVSTPLRRSELTVFVA